jgi:hypothetical protein
MTQAHLYVTSLAEKVRRLAVVEFEQKAQKVGTP